MRVSASDLDAFRYWRASEDADLGELIAQLRRETEPTESMRAGTALHTALENADPGEFKALEADGFVFELEIDGELDLPPIREIKHTLELEIDGEPVTLVGKVDAVLGRRVDDHKFTSSWDAERFLASYQWRVYLEVFDADEFRWNVFEGRKISAGFYRIGALHTLHMYRYPGMRQDIERELLAFLDFARIHLPERIERQKAA